MAAYLIGHIAIKDALKWEEYRRQVPATLAPWRAELVFRGRRFAVFSGTHAPADTVVIRFPEPAAIDAWFSSPAYQTLIPLREHAADVVLIAYEAE